MGLTSILQLIILICMLMFNHDDKQIYINCKTTSPVLLWIRAVLTDVHLHKGLLILEQFSPAVICDLTPLCLHTFGVGANHRGFQSVIQAQNTGRGTFFPAMRRTNLLWNKNQTLKSNEAQISNFLWLLLVPVYGWWHLSLCHNSQMLYIMIL